MQDLGSNLFDLQSYKPEVYTCL